MSNSLAIKKGFLAFVVALIGVFSFAQGGGARQSLVTELREAGSAAPMVSIALPDQSMVAFAQFAEPAPVETKYSVGGSNDAKTYEITPLAKIQVFRRANAKSAKFVEQNDFSSFDQGLVLTVHLPEDAPMLWFHGAGKKSPWLPVADLQGSKEGYDISVVDEDESGRAITIKVTLWPKGDPMMGAGPRPR
jgi:hypothetical protein